MEAELYRMPDQVICYVCDEPILWCLDMYSYSCTIPHKLGHARCLWLPEAFENQGKLAGKIHAEEIEERLGGW